MSNHSILSFNNITHFYGDGEQKLVILNKLNFDLPQGKICALLGPSGSGKSTILQLAGLLDTPKSGDIIINQKKINTLSDKQKDSIRGQEIGFIYQFHRLLPELTAVENVMMPQLFFNQTPDQAKKRAIDLLTELGLQKRLNHLPSELSGGEQQRVAIARALANKPKLILADEPTGNLDPITSQDVFRQLTEFVQSQGASALIATHNMELAQQADFTFQPFKSNL